METETNRQTYVNPLHPRAFKIIITCLLLEIGTNGIDLPDIEKVRLVNPIVLIPYDDEVCQVTRNSQSDSRGFLKLNIWQIWWSVCDGLSHLKKLILSLKLRLVILWRLNFISNMNYGVKYVLKSSLTLKLIFKRLKPWHTVYQIC